MGTSGGAAGPSVRGTAQLPSAFEHPCLTLALPVTDRPRARCRRQGGGRLAAACSFAALWREGCDSRGCSHLLRSTVGSAQGRRGWSQPGQSRASSCHGAGSMPCAPGSAEGTVPGHTSSFGVHPSPVSREARTRTGNFSGSSGRGFRSGIRGNAAVDAPSLEEFKARLCRALSQLI